jgi:3',5'-cyclic AMP phosphodiesterase CpdA
MRRLAHISDLHFDDADEPLVLELADELDDFDPDLIVVTGDVTKDARPSQFERARGFLDSLPFPRLVIPGNHDIAPVYHPVSRLFDPYGRYRQYFPYDLNGIFADDEILVLGVNTVHPLQDSDGMVSDDQLSWVESLVSHHPDRFHVLAAHHPLVHVEGEMLRETKPLNAVLAGTGIELVLTGHLRASQRHRVRELAGPSESMLVARASTATTLEHGRIAYNRIAVAGQKVHIDLRSFDGDTFVSEHCGSYERRDGAWQSLAEISLLSAPSPDAAQL